MHESKHLLKIVSKVIQKAKRMIFRARVVFKWRAELSNVK